VNCELDPQDTATRTTRQYQALLAVVEKIRASLALDEILQTTVAEVRHLLQADRVGIYRFDSQSQWQIGEFVAESVASPYGSLLGWKISETCFAEKHRIYYQQGRKFILEDLETAPLQDCHRQMLQGLGLRANVVVSLLAGDRLWGLLTVHQCERPRTWEPESLEFIDHIALHLGVAIQQAELLAEQKRQAKALAHAIERSRVTETLIDKIRRSHDLTTVLTTATREIQRILQLDWVAIYQFTPKTQPRQGRFLAVTLAAHHSSFYHAPAHWQDWPLNLDPESYLAIADVQTAPLEPAARQSLLDFQTLALLYFPLFKDQEFWGVFCLHQFQHPRPWTPDEITFVQKISLQLGMALYQGSLLLQAHNQTAALNTMLAQTQQQKEELQKSAQRERALADVIDKIRRTLDLTTIFQTTVTEVRQLLKGDRCYLFQFCPEGQSQQGMVVAEDILPGFTSLLKVNSPLIPQGDFLDRHYFHNGLILAFDDLQDVPLTPEFLNLANLLEIRAMLVVPLFQGDNLWGLLGIHQCWQTRVWQSAEIEFVLKVANQLGIAVDQAKLWEQMREKSQTLEMTLTDLNAIMDNLADGLLVTDVLGNITRFNPRLKAMFDLENLELKGYKLADKFPPELVQLIEHQERQEQGLITAEFPLSQGRLGQALASSIIKRSSPQEGEQCLGSVIVIRDVTQERELDRMKMNFLATVSHELRTPLTSVLGFASLITSKLEKVIFPLITDPTPKQQKAIHQVQGNLQIIVTEAERLTQLINEVLDIAKMEAGKMELHRQLQDPEALLQQAIASMMPLFEQKSISLITQFEPDLPPIWVDGDRVIQVLLNLLSNAWKFTEQGQVICCVGVKDQTLQVSIIDTGGGIAPEDLQKIFHPFQQGGNLLTNKPQGTGLGLPICQQIIEHHGGQITVESQPGQGSHFRFWLPLPVENNE